ncbi:MAG: glutathione S-transferase [Rhodobacterales bacterium 32-66-7]|nr:MAG: glutathione S-transferase [Rhodobacterales bacterium 32-66-7]
MLTLYYAPGTCSLATRIALIDAGAEYTSKKLDFSKGEQRTAEFLALNPKGRVPALATDHGLLTENTALLIYIAQSWPAARLAPLDNPVAMAQLQAFNSYLSSTVHVAHAHGYRGNRWTDDPAAIQAMKAFVPTSMTAALHLVETHFLQGPFVMGASYTVADAYLFTMALWIEGDGVDPAALPRIIAHREMMQARPSVIRALAEEV